MPRVGEALQNTSPPEPCISNGPTPSNGTTLTTVSQRAAKAQV